MSKPNFSEYAEEVNTPVTDLSFYDIAEQLHFKSYMAACLLSGRRDEAYAIWKQWEKIGSKWQFVEMYRVFFTSTLLTKFSSKWDLLSETSLKKVRND